MGRKVSPLARCHLKEGIFLHYLWRLGAAGTYISHVEPKMGKTAKTKQNQEGPSQNGPGFVHLRVRTAYSLLESALPIKTLLKLAQQDAMPALGIADSNNLFGALEFSETFAAAGIQPIIGCAFHFAFADADEAANGAPASPRPSDASLQPDGILALIAQNETGYRNLMKLSSRAFLDSVKYPAPVLTLAHLDGMTEGLIALSGGPNGPIDQTLRGDAKTEALARKRLQQLAVLFPNRLYVELQRQTPGSTSASEAQMLALAYELELPIVATQEAFFPTKEDFEAHDALICIAEGTYVSQDDRRRLTPEHYFKSRAEMQALFADLPEALANTVEIARRCSFRPTTHPPILPNFMEDAPAGSDMLALEAAELSRQAEAGLKARLAAEGTAEGHDEKTYFERLKFELDIIISMKFPGYFLIVADFIKWAKSQGIPVGPGRGSGAGSIVAWALTITDLDPIRFGLLFERFLNPERVSMPDFDIDFCQDRRDEVIRYVQQKYGRDRVAQIITFGKLQARAVLRDVGRVLQMPYGQVDRLCKLVPNNPANPVTLEQAIRDEPKLQEEAKAEAVVARLMEIAQKLEGLYRHASTHAAGVVIGDRPLDELVPLYQDPRSPLPATQFNMKWVEPAGLVKFDFLGLKTLTVIQKALQLIEQTTGKSLDFSRDQLNDKKAFELLAKGNTVGVFQLESTGMRESLRRLKPDRFEDIIAMVSLYRPGPMDNIPTYINRKFGREEPDYLHDMLKPILEETYGVIIYQEQVMQIAQVMADYTLGEADLLRRAMGKKIKAEMDRQRDRFVSGAVKNGVDEAKAKYIFELVDKFAGYGFNKSHAAAYALLAYRTAYLKANYPVEFMAALMTLDQGNTDKVNVMVREAKSMGIAILPPCINKSRSEFVPEQGAIRYSLAALKNIGTQAVESIVAAREADGPYKSLADFAQRLDPRSVNKRALETLAAAGAFDDLQVDRATAYENVDRLLAAANRTSLDRAIGQSDLFGSVASGPPPVELRPVRPWRLAEQLNHEFNAVGFYLSGHPLDEYTDLLAKLRVLPFAEFAERVRNGGPSTGKIAGTVSYKQERRSKSGNKFAFAGFSDPSGQFEAVVFSETLQAARDLLEPGTAVLLNVEADYDEAEGEAVKLRLLSVHPLESVAGKLHKGVRVRVADPAALVLVKQEIERDNPRRNGELQLLLEIPERGEEVELKLRNCLTCSPRLTSQLKTLPGVVDVVDI